MRGYFDGDGCFSIVNRRTRKGQLLAFNVTSNYRFLEQYQEQLVRSYGFRPVKLHRCKCKSEVYMLECGGTRKSLQFAHFLYQDATVYLPRKRDKVREFLRSRPDLAALYPDLL